jgi:hypothetical protein
MRLGNRVEKLERAFNIGGDGEACGCYGVGRRDTRICDEENPEEVADAETRPAAICEMCGRPKRILIIRLISSPTAML